MIGMILIIVIILGGFAGVPLAVWIALGCPHADDE